MNIEIGSYEAKTRLPELLRGVQLGNRYTITLRGRAVAELIPSGISDHNAVVAAVAQMNRFMSSHDAVHGIEIKALIDGGRD